MSCPRALCFELKESLLCCLIGCLWGSEVTEVL